LTGDEQSPANDNDLVSWWHELLPLALSFLILSLSIRAALRAFF